MCFFKTVTFEMYTSEPRLKGDYYQPGETDEQYHRRMLARRQEARSRNIAENLESRAAGNIIRLRKVAE